MVYICLKWHLTRGRGLKLRSSTKLKHIIKVASYVGAWIETLCMKKITIIIKVASYVGAWIETTKAIFYIYLATSRILRGCVD